MRDIIRIFSPNCSNLAFNCSFTPDIVNEHKQLRKVILRHGDGMAMNFNFPDALRKCTDEWSYTQNPSVLPSHVKSLRASTSVISIKAFKNEYNKHPCWRAECERRESELTLWLKRVWGELIVYIPSELVNMVLDIWYTSVDDEPLG